MLSDSINNNNAPTPFTAVNTNSHYQVQLFLSPNEILADPAQVREYQDEEAFEKLARSIAELGILQPLNVERLGDGRYRIVAGSRRLMVARRLGLRQVPCLVVVRAEEVGSQVEAAPELSRYQRIIHQFSENTVRAGMDALDEAIALKTAKVLADIEMAKVHLGSLKLGPGSRQVEIILPDAAYLLLLQPEPDEATNPASLTNRQRLNLYEAYLAELIRLLTRSDVAERLRELNPQLIYPIQGRSGGGSSDAAAVSYALTNQALAKWKPIEKACAISKASRVSLMKLLELDPAVIELLRGGPGRDGGKTTGAGTGEETTGAGAEAGSVRGRLVAATRLPLRCQKEVIESYHKLLVTDTATSSSGGNDSSRGNPVRIEPKILELISAALFHEELRPLWDSQSQSDAQPERDQEEVLATSQQSTIATAADGEQHGGVDYARLVSLALELPTQHASGEWLARCYLGLASPTSSTATATATAASTNSSSSSSTASIRSENEPIYEEEETTDEAVEQGRTGVGFQGNNGSFSSNNNPKRHKGSSDSPAEGRGRSGQSGSSASSKSRGHSSEYGDEDSYGSGSDSAALDDDDDTAGFEFTFASAGEIPPGLAEELEAQGYSETAQKALATLAPKDREALLELISVYPQVKGKVRRIISLMNREGWSLTASLDEIMVGWHGGLPPVSASVLASELTNGEAASLEMENIADTHAVSASASAEEVIVMALSKIVDAATNFTKGLDMLKQGATRAVSNVVVAPKVGGGIATGRTQLQPPQTLKHFLTEPYQSQLKEVLNCLISAIEQTELGFEDKDDESKRLQK